MNNWYYITNSACAGDSDETPFWTIAAVRVFNGELPKKSYDFYQFEMDALVCYHDGTSGLRVGKVPPTFNWSVPP